MGQILDLVRPAVSVETIDALLFLLEEARAGRVLGVAWVAVHAGRRFTGDAVGETRTHPTFTRGMLRVLDDELGKLGKPF